MSRTWATFAGGTSGGARCAGQGGRRAAPQAHRTGAEVRGAGAGLRAGGHGRRAVVGPVAAAEGGDVVEPAGRAAPAGAGGPGDCRHRGVAGDQGVKKKFYEDLDRSELPARTAGFLEKFGMVGWTAKGVATTIVGLLVVWAAWTVDPNQATGVDGALKTLAAQPFGTLLLVLVLVGLGLVAFGLYCFGWAKAPRLTHHNQGR